MKNGLVDKAAVFLLRQGFTVKSLSRGCFDLLVRGQEKILLVKLLEDANSVSRQYVEEMGTISAYINATPLIIAEKAGSKLEDNVLYTRFGMCTLNFETFRNSVKQKFPFIKRTQAGLTASLNGNELRRIRENEGYSVNSLSKKIGVTKSMVARYESSDCEVTISRAMKIYNLFGEKVFREFDIFSHNRFFGNKHKSDFSKKYVELGFEASDTSKTPFDVIARKDDEIILTEVGDKSRPDFSPISKLLDADNLVIFNRKKPKGVPAVSREEFLEFDKANELIKFLKEF